MQTHEDENETMEQFCHATGVTIEATPSGEPSPYSDTLMDGWTVRLMLEGRTIEQKYWRGIGYREWIVIGSVTNLGEVPPWSARAKESGWRKELNPNNIPRTLGPSGVTVHIAENARYRPIPPTAADVLGCLCSDAQGVDHGETFEDWASDFGYDTDSRKAERIYHECQSIALRLRGFLGTHYDRAMRAEW
jgi:hypothetical protein